MRAGALADRGVRLALGTDLGAGHNLGVYSQVGRAVQLSKLKAFYEPDGNRAISFAQAFYMATRGGGSLFGKVGALEPGYRFDALRLGGLADAYENLSPVQIVERFCYLGDKSHIRARYLAGRRLD